MTKPFGWLLIVVIFAGKIAPLFGVLRYEKREQLEENCALWEIVGGRVDSDN